MKCFRSSLLIALYLLSSCTLVNSNEKLGNLTLSEHIDEVGFKNVLMTVSNGWESNNARLAVNVFTLDAVYIEAPNQ